jgi:hypothetical protein
MFFLLGGIGYIRVLRAGVEGGDGCLQLSNGINILSVSVNKSSSSLPHSTLLFLKVTQIGTMFVCLLLFSKNSNPLQNGADRPSSSSLEGVVWR